MKNIPKEKIHIKFVAWWLQYGSQLVGSEPFPRKSNSHFRTGFFKRQVAVTKFRNSVRVNQLFSHSVTSDTSTYRVLMSFIYYVREYNNKLVKRDVLVEFFNYRN